jgi:hypothetical protein
MIMHTTAMTILSCWELELGLLKEIESLMAVDSGQCVILDSSHLLV